MIRRTFNAFSVSTSLLRLTEARGELAVFCYLMGVDIFSTGRARNDAPLSELAERASLAVRTRNQVACSNLYSTFSALFLTLKD